MIYRATGQFRSTYAADEAIFPLVQDRWAMGAFVVLAFTAPLFVGEYWLRGLLIPVLFYSLAALGLNILTGYTGQVSLGQAAFMAVGAYTAYNLASRLELNILLCFLGGGLMAAAVGVLFGLPSLRIKGFYLVVTTLAAQFTIEWVINHFPWLSGGNVLGSLDTPPIVILGFPINTVARRYWLALFVVVVLTLFAKNLVRGEIGRAWQAVRDRDVAAQIIGINIFRKKLSAFAVSAFYAGVAGSMLAFIHLEAVQITEFELLLSFNLLGMVIIGGLGSILGSFLGATFFVVLPIFINRFLGATGGALRTSEGSLSAVLELMVFGGLIVFFLIVEPLGLARLWTRAKEKLLLWPFPY
ncbi:MAG: branched-chain amino acid ABC transporter permease [Candidatus Methylomirabilia bacterium]